MTEDWKQEIIKKVSEEFGLNVQNLRVWRRYQRIIERTQSLAEEHFKGDYNNWANQIFQHGEKTATKELGKRINKLKAEKKAMLARIEERFNMEHACGCPEWCDCWKKFKEELTGKAGTGKKPTSKEGVR